MTLDVEKWAGLWPGVELRVTPEDGGDARAAGPEGAVVMRDLRVDGTIGWVIAANTAVVQDQDKKCRAAGKSIKMSNTQNAAAAILALKSGQVDAHLEDAPVAAYIAATSGKGKDFLVVGRPVSIRNHGMIFKKSNRQLRDAIRATLKSVIADGTYDRILKKYNVENIALRTAPINDPRVTP